MAILTNAGRIAVAAYIADQPIHMAWGRGDPDWDTTAVAPSAAETALVDEIARLKATSIQFVVPDEGGSIDLPDGRFTLSGEPTNYLYLNFNFKYTQGVGEKIRELAVFLGTREKPTVLAGTTYLLPDQISEPGRMLVVERIDSFTRSDNTRQNFAFVIQF